jgi:arylsulfatase A-like enzyme
MARNVMLLVVDTLRRKDMVEDNSLAPFLTQKMREEVYLKNFRSNAPWTVPSHASIFSGKLPSEHGSTTENTYFQDQNRLTQVFKERDYRTSGVTENMLITKETGFSQGFDDFIQTTQDLGGETWREIWEKDEQFEDRKEKYSYFFQQSLIKRDLKSFKSLALHLRDKFSPKEAKYNGDKEVKTLEIANNFLHREGKNFVFANIMPVHAPYAFNSRQKERFFPEVEEEKLLDASETKLLEDFFPEGFDEEKIELRKKTYKAAVNYTDSIIEDFYHEAPENTIFVVLGDHGELTGEYQWQGIDLIGHHLGTYKELIQVPFLIFTKGEEIESEIKEEDFYGSKDIVRLLDNILDSESVEGNDIINSEYFGRKGLVHQFNREIPEGCEEIYNRKSFSLIDSQVKYDITNEGEYAWKTESLTEDEELDLQEASELENKAEILYKWRF